MMRLDRFIAETTGMSRKDASKVVHSGAVTVQGMVQRKGAYQVPEGAEVLWQEQQLQLQGPTYLMLHKPVGCVCANEDSQHETVFSYLDLPQAQQLHTVGRLDKDTSGLLLITNDGQWSHRITAPKRECLKVYRAWLAEPLATNVKEKFAQGLLLRGESKITAPAQLEFVTSQEVVVRLHEGRYHQVRRMFAAVGNRVDRLHREQVGSLLLDPHLAVGEYRLLTAAEVALF